MHLDAVLDRARNGHASRSDIERLREYLLNDGRDYDRLHAAMTLYLDQAPAIDPSIVQKYIEFPDDPMISAAVIFSAASRIGADDPFWDKVVSIALGVPWDEDNSARVQALLALHYIQNEQVYVREIIRVSLLSDWESVRDSAAIAAQRCFGRNERDVVSGGPSGRLIERVGEDILNWIWPDRSQRAVR